MIIKEYFFLKYYIFYPIFSKNFLEINIDITNILKSNFYIYIVYKYIMRNKVKLNVYSSSKSQIVIGAFTFLTIIQYDSHETITR